MSNINKINQRGYERTLNAYVAGICNRCKKEYTGLNNENLCQDCYEKIGKYRQNGTK